MHVKIEHSYLCDAVDLLCVLGRDGSAVEETGLKSFHDGTGITQNSSAGVLHVCHVFVNINNVEGVLGLTTDLKEVFR
jgi:hypothetical protein